MRTCLHLAMSKDSPMCARTLVIPLYESWATEQPQPRAGLLFRRANSLWSSHVNSRMRDEETIPNLTPSTNPVQAQLQS